MIHRMCKAGSLNQWSVKTNHLKVLQISFAVDTTCFCSALIINATPFLLWTMYSKSLLSLVLFFFYKEIIIFKSTLPYLGSQATGTSKIIWCLLKTRAQMDPRVSTGHSTPASLFICRVQHQMSSFRATSKLVNPIGTKDAGKTLQRYLQRLRRGQPEPEMRKLARSSLCSAEALGCPFSTSHEHSARMSEQTTQNWFESPEINTLCSVFLPHEPCSCNTRLGLIKPARTKLIAHESRPGICIPARANLQHRWSEDNSILDYLYTKLFLFTLQIQKPTRIWDMNKISVPRQSIYNGNSFSAITFTQISDIHWDI